MSIPSVNATALHWLTDGRDLRQDAVATALHVLLTTNRGRYLKDQRPGQMKGPAGIAQIVIKPAARGAHLAALWALWRLEGERPGDHAHIVLAHWATHGHHWLGVLVCAAGGHHQFLHLHQPAWAPTT